MESDSSSGWQGKGALEELLRERIRTTIESIVDEELEASLGAARWQRSGPVRAGYRHGKRSRTLTTSLGPTTIAMPRARLEGEDGRRRKWRSAIIPRYQRRTERVDEAILGVYLSGTNTRRLRGALAPLLRGAPLSKDAVSRLVGRLREDFAAWAQRELGELKIRYLFLDGWYPPPDGSTAIGVNVSIRVRFSEPIDPLTVNATSIQVTGGNSTVVPSSISFDSSNQNVSVVPQAPLPDGTLMTLTVTGVQDLAGNSVTAHATHFTTTTGPDFVPPVVVTANPFPNATNVPLKAAIVLHTSEPIGVDPVSWSVFGRKGKEESDAKNTSTVPGRVSAADGRTGARGTVAEGVSA